LPSVTISKSLVRANFANIYEIGDPGKDGSMIIGKEEWL